MGKLSLMDEKSQQEILHDYCSALGYEDDSILFIRLIHDKDKTIAPQKKHVKLKDLPNLLTELNALNRGDFAVQMVVNGGGDSDDAVKKHKIARAQFCEMDEHPLEYQLNYWKQFPLEPSMLIQTQKSIHAYWILVDGDIKLFRDIQIRLATFCGGDGKIINESRTMRMPAFYHNKTDEAVLVKIIKFNPELKYTQEQFDEVLPPVEEKSVKSQKRYVEAQQIRKGDRQHELARACGYYWQKGYSREECIAQVKRINAEKCEIPLSDAELEKSVFPIMDKYKQGNFLDRFHKFNKYGTAVDIYDDYIVDYIISKYRLMVIHEKPYIYRGGVYRLDENGLELKAIIKKFIFPSVVTANNLQRVYKLCISDISLQKTIEDVNAHPKHFVNFKNGMFDAKSGKLLKHSPEYFSINQIPHEYRHVQDAGKSVSYRFICGLIPNKADRRMFLQYAGYCFTTETYLQKFLTLLGEGNTGKSTVIRLLTKAIGVENISNLKLQDVNQRFYPTQLLGKLDNFCSDIPSDLMEQVDNLKMITGEDRLMAEYKGGAIFFFTSYAKLLFSANRMPKTNEDSTGAYYRRLMIIRIRDRGEYIESLEEKLEADIPAFISICMDGLMSMYKYGFAESASSIEEVNQLRKDSDTVEGFLQDVCTKVDGNNSLLSTRTDTFEAYVLYCSATDRTAKSKHNFYQFMSDKGYSSKTIGGYKYFNGNQIDWDKLNELKQGIQSRINAYELPSGWVEEANIDF